MKKIIAILSTVFISISSLALIDNGLSINAGLGAFIAPGAIILNNSSSQGWGSQEKEILQRLGFLPTLNISLDWNKKVYQINDKYDVMAGLSLKTESTLILSTIELTTNPLVRMKLDNNKDLRFGIETGIGINPSLLTGVNLSIPTNLTFGGDVNNFKYDVKLGGQTFIWFFNNPEKTITVPFFLPKIGVTAGYQFDLGK